jgi:hypothetical protein
MAIKFLVRLKRMKLEFMLDKLNTENSEKIYQLILDDVDSDLLKSSNPLFTSGCKFNCIFHTLREYNKTLTRLIVLLQHNQMIGSDWCRYEFIKVPFDAFFTDELYYVDKVTELNEFVRLVRLFKSELVQTNVGTIGIKGHNQRHMNRLNTHINDLLVQIIKATYEIHLYRPGEV